MADMSKWKKDVKEYLSVSNVTFITENDNILLFRWYPRDSPQSKYVGIILKKLNKWYCVHIASKNVYWKNGKHHWSGKSSICKFNFLSEDLKYLEDAIFVSMI
jgi:hypothetical protein